jgi:paraquat-inducible protein B
VADDPTETPRLPPGPEIVRRRRFPLVWLIPIAASLIGIAMLVQSWRSSGPRVWIEFNNAQGLTAGKTHVSYKDVVVGTVSAVSLSKDRSGVVATVDFVRDARDLLKDDTHFWIVRPQIGAAGISGIETLLSGVYIAMDPGSTGDAQTHYKAMVDAPMVTRGSAGKRFLLKAADIGSLYVGAPIYFHHLKAGRLISYQMSPDKSLDVRIFIDAPYDGLVHPTTRFWNASGVDLSLTAAGLKVETQALATIVAGGIAFDDPPAVEVTPAAAADSTFYLTGDRTSAMADPDGPPLRMRMRFDSPLRGLAIGAPVEFFGVSIGNVVRVAVDYDPPTQRFSLVVDVVTYPHRLGSVLDKFPAHDEEEAKVATFIASMVHSGLRAQARTGNLLTGQLYVALDFVKSPPAATFDTSARPLMIPTVGGSVDKLQRDVGDFVAKLDRLPLDSIGKRLDQDVGELGTTLQLLNTKTLPGLSDTLADSRKVLQGAGGALDPDASLQLNLNDLLRELTQSARSIRVLTDMLSAHPESLIRGRRAAPVPKRATQPTAGASTGPSSGSE